jgi:hypothetical protein
MSDAPVAGRHRRSGTRARRRLGRGFDLRVGPGPDTSNTSSNTSSNTTRNGADAGGRTRNRARALIVTPLLAAAIGGGLAAAAGPANAATTWDGLRQCESGGDYGTNTGNGFYGAYQFSPRTWHSLGYSGLPSDASPAVQDEAARRLAKRDGFNSWPHCGRGMGGGDLANGASYEAPHGASRNGRRAVLPSAGTADSRGGPSFTTALVGQFREDVRSWQAQMKKKGFDIAVDGRYGPESESAARALQAAKGISTDGICGQQTWTAAFGA